MLRRQLDIDAGGCSRRVAVLDSQVWQRDLVVDDAQVVLLGGLLLKFGEALVVAQLLPAERGVNLALELVVEYDSVDGAVGGFNPLALGLVDAVEGEVVRQFGRLDETGVELLPPLVAEGAFLIGEPLAVSGQRNGWVPLAAFANGNVASFDESLSSERPKILAHASLVSGVAVLQQILLGDRAERADLLERSHFALAQTICSVAQRDDRPAVAEGWALPVEAGVGLARGALLSARRSAATEGIRARVSLLGSALSLSAGLAVRPAIVWCLVLAGN
jgi:hypothetical protein